jgi:DNA-directed RNA polymerase subunit omega
MANKSSSIPLGPLVSTDKNMYELTNAAIHRAKQISMAGSEELEASGGKIVSLAISEIVTGEVLYSIKKQD